MMPDKALYEGPQSDSSGAQENSKGQSKKIPRAPREGPQERLEEGPNRRLKKASREHREVPPERPKRLRKRLKRRPDSTPRRRRPKRNAEDVSGRAPRVAQKWPQEVLQEGPERCQQERQN